MLEYNYIIILINTIKKRLQLIFKEISYGIFKLLYGSVERIETNSENIEIINSIFENHLNYKIYLVKNSRIYTDTIHDTAFIKNNFIIQGPSFQFRNNVIADCNKNIVFKKGTPRIKKKLKGKIFSLLTGGGGNSNYYHWLFDVLPRLIILRKEINLNSIDYFLLPDTVLPFQKESLDLLNIPLKKRISSQKFRHVESDEILSVDHPCIILNDPLKDNNDIPNWIIDFYKNEVKNKISFKNTPKKIFIDRGDSQSNIKHLRKIINENEVKMFLKSNGFDIIKLSLLSFKNQIELFHNSKIIVGLHGAGFSNILFCQPKTKVIEIKPLHVGNQLEKLGNKLNLDYVNLESPSENINLKFPNQLGDIRVDLKELKKELI